MTKNQIVSDVESKLYTVKIAKSKEEVDAALRLRYRVFKEELERDFQFSDEKDHNEYDDQSHHLIVVNNESDEIVGTYRLQTFEQARNGNGFASNKRFHLEQFPEDVLKNAVEVGRACIRREHRSGRVLFLLWKGFAMYLTYFKKQYLFGYAALDTSDPVEALNIHQHLKEKGFLHPRYLIDAREEYRIDHLLKIRETNEVEIPPLFQNYLDVGSTVCSAPSLDKKLRLAHCLILLDIENISDRTKKMFFG